MLLPILAQAAEGAASSIAPWLGPIFQYGGIGVCLAWFMFRSEPRLRAIEAAIDRVTRGMVVATIAIANALEALQWHAAKSLKVQAETLDRELDDAAKNRGAKE